MSTFQADLVELETHLHQNRALLFTNQHRDKKNKRTFANAGSFKVGVGSTNPGHIVQVRKGNPDFAKHPFKNTGVNVKPVAEQPGLSDAKKKAYDLAAGLIEKVDPWFAAGEFIVQFALMNRPEHHVKVHKDLEDITYQYALSLGDYSGAELRVWNSAKTGYVQKDNRGRFLKFDGRNAHEVIMKDFQGERFTVIYYKNYDTRLLTGPLAIFEEVEWAAEPEESSTVEHASKRRCME